MLVLCFLFVILLFVNLVMFLFVLFVVFLFVWFNPVVMLSSFCFFVFSTRNCATHTRKGILLRACLLCFNVYCLVYISHLHRASCNFVSR